MLKLIKTDRERPGGGKISRFVLELPWFSVWIDLCEVELIGYREPKYMGEMLHSELSNAAHKAFRVMVNSSFSSGCFEVVGGLEGFDA